MKLSIITINFNNVSGLKRTAASVMEQTWQEFEWIIIDGGSDDGSTEYIVSLNEDLTRNGWNPITYWCSEPDNGIYNAMNKGVLHAGGQYVCCMNSGDEFYNENTLRDVFLNKEHTEDILYGNSMKVYTDGHTQTDYAPEQVNLLNLYFRTICQQGMYVRLEMLKEKPFDERFKVRGDSHRWLQALLDGNSFKYLYMTTCRFHMDGISASSRKHEKEDAMISELINPAILPYVVKVYRYECYHPYTRLTALLERGGLVEKVTKAFLKIMTMIWGAKSDEKRI